MLRVVLSRAVLAIVVVFLGAKLAVAVPMVLSHQGRLLDASDHPLSGTFTLIYSIHDAPVGGTQLWMEDHVGVTVTDGLFTVELGSTVPLSADIVAGSGGGGGGGGGAIRYLQVQISGQPPITPRTPLTASPYSVATQRVSGDVQTLPGEMIIHCTACSAVDGITLSSDVDSDELSMVRLNGLPPGTPYIGRVAVSSSSSQSSIALGDLDADGALDLHCGPDSTVFDMGSSDIGTLVSSYRAKAGKTGSTKRMMHSSGSSVSGLDEVCDATGVGLKLLNTASSGNQGWSLSCMPDSIVNEERISDGRADVVLYKATTGKSGKAKQSLFMAPGGGTTEVDEDCGSTGASLRMKVDGLMGPRMSTNLTVGKQSSRILLEADLDGDGLVENSCTSTSDSTHTGVSVSSRFGSGPRQTTSMDGSFSHSHLRCDSDSDDDGVADNSVVSEATSSGSSLRVISLNGLPPGEPILDNIALNANGSSSTVALKKGVAQVGLSVAGSVGIPGASILSSRCLSVSGLDSSSTEQSSNGTLAAMRATATKSTGATLRAASIANDSGTVATDCDDDADGFSERATWTTSNPGIARSVVAADLDGDGDFDNLATQTCDATSSQIEASSASGSGIGAKTATLTVSASPGGSACRAINTNGNGAIMRSAIGATDTDAAHMVLETDSDGDGTAEYTYQSSCDSSSARGQLTGVAPGTSNVSTVTWEVDATGPEISLTQDGVVIHVMNGDGSVLRNAANVVMADLDIDGEMYLASRLAIASPSGTHHIDVAGGAYCDGTNWVNASDKNSKENFEKIDGEELLEKISDLEITKWNYKGDKDAEHIGPTAQDFKKAFGVGADDKSISTIDPSGIALAAIKELYAQLKSKDREMDEQLKARDKQISELREQLEKLQKLIKKN